MTKRMPRPEPSAKDVMNSEILTVRDDLSLPELAAFLAENQITGAPVVDGSGRIVGVVSVTDFAEAESEGAWEPGDRVLAAERRGLHVEAAGRQVREIMTPTVYTVAEQTPASELARAMITGRVHRLFVTKNGRIVGIVTSLDLLKLLCEPGAAGSRRTTKRPSGKPVVAPLRHRKAPGLRAHR